MVAYREASIYPNPSEGRFTIEMDNRDGEDIDLEVVSLLGQTVWTVWPTMVMAWNGTMTS